jgi:transcriptional regulator with XRE-family HTH domain
MARARQPASRTKTGGSRDLVMGFETALRSARDGLGLTQAQVDERAGLAAGTTAQLEGGRRGPTLRMALRLHGAIGLDLHSLVAEKG